MLELLIFIVIMILFGGKCATMDFSSTKIIDLLTIIRDWRVERERSQLENEKIRLEIEEKKLNLEIKKHNNVN